MVGGDRGVVADHRAAHAARAHVDNQDAHEDRPSGGRAEGLMAQLPMSPPTTPATADSTRLETIRPQCNGSPASARRTVPNAWMSTNTPTAVTIPCVSGVPRCCFHAATPAP